MGRAVAVGAAVADGTAVEVGVRTDVLVTTFRSVVAEPQAVKNRHTAVMSMGAAMRAVRCCFIDVPPWIRRSGDEF